MRKALLLVLILTALLAFLFVIAATKEGPVKDRLSKVAPVASFIQKAERFTQPYLDATERLGRKLKIADKRSSSTRSKVRPVEEREGEAVTLYFKDGTSLQGALLKETEDLYIVNWKGVDFDIPKGRVKRMLRGKEALSSRPVLTDSEIIRVWPYKNDIVVRLTNRMVLDAEIDNVKGDQVSLVYNTEGGGRIEQEVSRSRIEYLIFKPVDNEKSRRIESSLKDLFPDMRFYRHGGFTIVTDSYADWVNKYEKVLKEVYTDIYLGFLKLFRGRRPAADNFVVIFDDYFDFFEYALTDRVPSWAVEGYFMPQADVLYLYNVLGDKYSQLLFDAFVGETGKQIDDIVDAVGTHIDKRYHIFLEGQAMQIKSMFWEAYDYYKGMYREQTMSTLRHEFTHETFHNWGLQTIILSKLKEDNKELYKKKRQMLESKDPKQKARILRELITRKNEPVEVQAANSWLAEGIATYCETYPLGAVNETWLYLYQEMDREGEVYPLESLTFHRMGSFPGVAPKAMGHSYAQSWAFVHFLMNRYPDEFMAYQDKMARIGARENEDISWLLDSVGRTLQELRQEFKEYMEQFEKVEDPQISRLVKLQEIFKSPY